jgi:hypothetical protein
VRELAWILFSLTSGCHLITGATDFETNDFVGDWKGSGTVLVDTDTGPVPSDVNVKLNILAEEGLLEAISAASTSNVDIDYTVVWSEAGERQYTVDLQCSPPQSCLALHDAVCMEIFGRSCEPNDARVPPQALEGSCLTKEDAEHLECTLDDQLRKVQLLLSFERED